MAQVQRTKMMWYYSAIIDWMIANPGRPLSECAKHIGRGQNTLSTIINSDMFKAALAQRKAEFQMRHDLSIIEKTTKVAHASLDAILESIEKKRDKIPLDALREISDSALSRLGYGTTPAANPGVVVNVQQNVVAPVSAQDLAEARMALRQVQAQKGGAPITIEAQTVDSSPTIGVDEFPEILDIYAEEFVPEVELAEETVDASAPDLP